MLLAGRMLGVAAERLFRHLEVDEEWLAEVRRAKQRGPLIYVMRNVSLLDYLALDHLTRRHALPRIGFVNELPAAVRPKGSRHPGGKLGRLRETVTSGRSAALFLKRRPERLAPGQRGRDEGTELLTCLMQLQRDGAVASGGSHGDHIMMMQISNHTISV